MLLHHSPNTVCYWRIARSASILNNIHVTLVLLASAFLLCCCVLATLEASESAASPSPALIALTVCEVQHLLAHLLFPAPTSVPLIVAWSLFRRTHQYWAGSSHRRRRLKVD